MSEIWRKVAVGGLAVGLLAVFMLACGTTKSFETDKANQAIKEANALLDDYNKLQTEINENINSTSAMSIDPAGLTQRLPIYQEIETKTNKQNEDLVKMVKVYENARKLYVSSETKTWIQMLIDTTKKHMEANAFNLQAEQNRVKLFQDIQAGGDAVALATASDDQVTKLVDEAKKKEDEAKALKVKADKYFADKNLSGTKK